MLASKVGKVTGEDKALTVGSDSRDMLNIVEECKLTEVTPDVHRFCHGVTNYVADYYTINLGTLIPSNIL